MEKAALYLKAATGGGHPEAPFIWARELEKGKLGEEEGEKRQEKAMELYHLAAQRSSPEANFHLSRCYFYGEGGVEVNKSLAAAYIRIATGLGCAEAQYILATTFEKGLWDDAIELSPDQVLRLYEEAAEQGDPGAATRMGLLHWIGAFGVEGDDDKAVEFFAIGAEQENSEAILRLGEAFMLGRGTKKDSKKAAALLRRVAHEEGEPLAYLLLGELFEKGEGVEKDADEASRLFEKAVACYVPHAFYRLRQLHRRGEGWQGITEEMVNYYDGFIQKFEENEYMHLSDKTALTVLKAHPKPPGLVEAVQRATAILNTIETAEDAEECFTIGWMLENGYFCPKDLQKALNMYRKAVDKGSLCAVTELGQMYLNGIGVEKDIEKGWDLLLQAAEKGDPDALNTAAFRYMHSLDVEEDKAKAKEMWTKAANMGDAEAEFQLAISAKLEGDIEKTHSLLESAAEKGHGYAIGVLGEWHIRGICVKQNDEKGAEMCSIGARRGHVRSLVCLAELHLRDSHGVDDNLKARNYLEIAAGKGNGNALMHLGVMYLEGMDGIPIDHVKAVKYFREAADIGKPSALVHLASMHLKEQGGLTADQEMIRELLLEAGRTGDPQGYYYLGCWQWRQGNVLGGQEIFKAALQGHTQAQIDLAEAYHNGSGMFPADEAKSAFWQAVVGDEEDVTS